MTELAEATERLEALRGEGSMLREEIQRLKHQENVAWTALRDVLQGLERARFKLDHVNAEIGKCSADTSDR